MGTWGEKGVGTWGKKGGNLEKMGWELGEKRVGTWRKGVGTGREDYGIGIEMVIINCQWKVEEKLFATRIYYNVTAKAQKVEAIKNYATTAVGTESGNNLEECLGISLKDHIPNIDVLRAGIHPKLQDRDNNQNQERGRKGFQGEIETL